MKKMQVPSLLFLCPIYRPGVFTLSIFPLRPFSFFFFFFLVFLRSLFIFFFFSKVGGRYACTLSRPGELATPTNTDPNLSPPGELPKAPQASPKVGGRYAGTLSRPGELPTPTNTDPNLSPPGELPEAPQGGWQVRREPYRDPESSRRRPTRLRSIEAGFLPPFKSAIR